MEYLVTLCVILADVNAGLGADSRTFWTCSGPLTAVAGLGSPEPGLDLVFGGTEPVTLS